MNNNNCHNCNSSDNMNHNNDIDNGSDNSDANKNIPRYVMERTYAVMNRS